MPKARGGKDDEPNLYDGLQQVQHAEGRRGPEGS
jgi:hypothetical protein